jgi:hypothetical protein
MVRDCVRCLHCGKFNDHLVCSDCVLQNLEENLDDKMLKLAWGLRILAAKFSSVCVEPFKLAVSCDESCNVFNQTGIKYKTLRRLGWECDGEGNSWYYLM